MYHKLPPGYITRSTFIVTISGTALYALTEYLIGSEPFFKNQFMPIVHRALDPEKAHRWGIRLAKYNLFPPFGQNRKEYKELECSVLGLNLKNPLGLAAGFDKDGEAINGLRKCGFGFLEIGTVTPLPQEGNPKPRLFRLTEDEALINRYGFNSAGAGPVYSRVQKAIAKSDLCPLGVNIGKNKDTDEPSLDYSIGINYFGPFCQYLVINVSSPNTPGLRALQKKEELQKLLVSVKSSVDRIGDRKPKVLLKIAPDLQLSELEGVAKVVLDKRYGIDGLIVSNTTVARPSDLKSIHKDEEGGLSGKPLRELSTESIRTVYRLTSGKVPIIGCGGISSGKDAYDKIIAGASLIQLYSSLVYEGFPVVGKVKRELAILLRENGYSSVAEAVGAEHRK